MKVVRLIFAILAGLWTVGVIQGVVSDFGKHGGTRGIADIGGSAFAICFMLIVTIGLFQGVFPKLRKSPVDYEPIESNESEEKP